MKALLLIFAALLFSPEARAVDCAHRLGVSAGLVHQDEPSRTNVALGAEYECRIDAFLGVGAFFDHVLSDPSYTLLGAPQLLVHPLGGDFFVAASPLLEFGPTGTHPGLRLSTRAPIPLSVLTFVPSFAVDFVNGRRLYWFGLGISI